MFTKQSLVRLSIPQNSPPDYPHQSPQDDKFFTDKDLTSRLVDVFHSAKPFLDYINRAIDYCREEKREYFSSLDF